MLNRHFPIKESPNLVLIGPFKQLLTMDRLPPDGHLRDEELHIIKDAGVVVHEGSIVTMGRFDELRKEGYAIEEIPYPAVALPGLIDAHTHLCYAGSRASEYAARLNGETYQQMIAGSGGIHSSVAKTRAASETDLIRLLLDRAALLLKHGVTTAEVKSGYGLNVSDEIKMLRAIVEAGEKQPVTLVPTCFAAHTRPQEFDSSTEYLSYLAQDLLVTIHKLNLCKRVDISINKETFSAKEAKDYLKAAKELGFSLIIHADQFARSGASALAAEMHTLSADDLSCSNDEDLEALKQSHVIPIVLPGTSLGLGTPFAPARKILDHDLPLVIASDCNPGSAPMGNLLTQAALLGAAQKLTMAETLAAITVRAARALELKDRGTLAHGMRGDLIAFPTEDYREILYHQGSLPPCDAFIKGAHYSLEKP